MGINDWELVLRLCIAVAFGSVIGLERERKNQAAGLRTHIAVILGATLVMLISIYGFSDVDVQTKDPARLAAQVVSGIGFLGAGMIIVNKNKIRGLTTAASLWTTACIGLAVGAGMYIPATAATLLLIGTLSVLQYFEHKHLKHRYKKMTAVVMDVDSFVEGLEEVLAKNGIILEKIDLKDTFEEDESKVKLTEINIFLHLPAYIDTTFLLGDISRIKGVRKIEDVK